MDNFSFLHAAAATDIGLRRQNNEDAILAIPEAGFFAVADGIGGGAAGEMASEAVREALCTRFDPTAPAANRTGDPVARAIRAVEEANVRIRREALHQEWIGTGTTVVVLVWRADDPRSAVILHAGDSRAYLWRNRRLQQLTIDHSLAASARSLGLAEVAPMFQGVITRAVGIEDEIELEQTPVAVEPGDLFILCSDGLTNSIPDQALAVLLGDRAPDGSLARLAAKLIEAANAAGGDDNISVVLIRVGPLRMTGFAIS
jgi:serine/threonine protein phosphatase PrpC